MKRFFTIFCIIIVHLCGICMLVGQSAFDDVRPRRFAGGTAGNAAGDAAGGTVDTQGGGFAPEERLPGAPINPPIGKIVWVSADGKYAVAWLDFLLDVPHDRTLGVRRRERAGSRRLAGVALVQCSRIHHSGGSSANRSIGLVIKNGIVRTGDELCIPSTALIEQLSKL